MRLVLTLNGNPTSNHSCYSATVLNPVVYHAFFRHLDVSQGDDTTMFLPVQYPKPTERLQALIAGMPNLRSLDISGTNLAGYAPVQKTSHRLEAKLKEEDPADE